MGMTKIPSFIEKMKHLKCLYLDENDIKSMKLDFTQMKSLEFLNICENPNFEFIDPSIYKSTSLLSLSYDDTKLENSLSNLDFISKSISESILDDIEDNLDELDGDIPKKERKKIEAVLQKRVDLYPSRENHHHFAKAYLYDYED